ncbi:MAG: nucleoside recognition domain-containing protein [Bacillota bacterium]|nr:nucleoside recognition domain-containing protein [Bacillota bacterium]
MILLGIAWATITGSLGDVTKAIITSAEEGVQLSIVLLGVLCLWSGLMKIAQKSGLIRMLTNVSKTVFAKLFPDVPENHSAMGAMVLSFAANFLGLGNAATPLGIKAMEELHKLNNRNDTASDAMVLFMVINASCLQFIPTNVIALREAAGSANAVGILPHVWISSFITTVTAIIFYYIFLLMEKRRDYALWHL